MISFQTEQKQKPITWSEQLPYWAHVTAFLRTGLVLDTFYTSLRRSPPPPPLFILFFALVPAF